MPTEDQSLTPVQSHLIERELLPHLDAMFNFAMHLTRYNENESNDLVQDAFLKACRAISQHLMAATLSFRSTRRIPRAATRCPCQSGNNPPVAPPGPNAPAACNPG
jgi:hypothetical protein